MNTVLIKKRLVSATLLSILLGILSSLIFTSYIQFSSPIPPGTFKPLLMVVNGSLQISTTSIAKNGLVEVWVRTDTASPQLTDSHISGTTIFSLVTIDCSNLKIGIGEQRAFDKNMRMIATGFSDNTLKAPSTVEEALVIIDTCHIKLKVKQPEHKSTLTLTLLAKQ